MSNHGYKKIKLKDGSTKDRHRILMEKILDRKLHFNEIVHHKDEDKGNDSISNLEVKLRSKHSKEHLVGKRSNFASLTDLQVREIKLLVGQGQKLRDIGLMFNVHRSTISHIKLNNTYKDVK
jgi:DNA-binding CsgD family transcriptional regulator